MLIFLDIETTGLEAEDKICSIGLIAIDNDKIVIKYELVNEGKKIPAEASSIHHITNEMIKDKCSFKESFIYNFLQENNNINTKLIAHNINFILPKLLASGFKYKGSVVDTLRVTKHLIPECELFSLQVLRYELKLYKNEKKEALKLGIKEDIIAHNALSDALIVKLLFMYLLDFCDIEKMEELSMKNVLLSKFEFGKYKGHYIEEIATNNRNYLEWMLENILDLDDDLRYSIKYYLKGCL